MFDSSSIANTVNPDILPHRAVSQYTAIPSSRHTHFHSPRIHNPRPIRVKHASMFQLLHGLLEMRLPVVNEFLPVLEHGKKCFTGQRSHAEISLVQLRVVRGTRSESWVEIGKAWIIVL